MKFDNNFKPKTGPEDFGWHSRGKLPHLDAECFTQFVTFRLFDSMPQNVLDRWRKEEQDDVAFRKRIEAYLDAGYGACWLRRPAIARAVENAIKFADGTKYELHAWVIMPNHVHVLLTQMPARHLPDIMHSIKSFSAQQCNKMLGMSGQFWQRESFDRYIRTPKHFSSVISYIEENPVKAGLCEVPEEWEFSSARRRQR